MCAAGLPGGCCGLLLGHCPAAAFFAPPCRQRAWQRTGIAWQSAPARMAVHRQRMAEHAAACMLLLLVLHAQKLPTWLNST